MTKQLRLVIGRWVLDISTEVIVAKQFSGKGKQAGETPKQETPKQEAPKTQGDESGGKSPAQQPRESQPQARKYHVQLKASTPLLNNPMVVVADSPESARVAFCRANGIVASKCEWKIEEVSDAERPGTIADNQKPATGSDRGSDGGSQA